jgi:hypothetical protein
VQFSSWIGALAEDHGFLNDPMLRSLQEAQLEPRRVVVEFQPAEWARLEATIKRQPFGPSSYIKALALRELERAAD